MKRALWIEQRRFPMGFKTMFVQRRFIKPSMLKHRADERRKYVFANKDRWTLLELLMAEREKEKL